MLHGANKGGVRPPAQSSAKTHMAVGSGSRPTMSKIPIHTSAPKHPKKLGRSTPNALK